MLTSATAFRFMRGVLKATPDNGEPHGNYLCKSPSGYSRGHLRQLIAARSVLKPGQDAVYDCNCWELSAGTLAKCEFLSITVWISAMGNLHVVVHMSRVVSHIWMVDLSELITQALVIGRVVRDHISIRWYCRTRRWFDVIILGNLLLIAFVSFVS